MTSQFFMEILSNTSGIIVAVIAGYFAFRLYNHKQAQNKKYEAYETIFERTYQLGDTCHKLMAAADYAIEYNIEHDIRDLSAKTTTDIISWRQKRHLVLLYCSEEFSRKFKSLEETIIEAENNQKTMFEDFNFGGYDDESYAGYEKK